MLNGFVFGDNVSEWQGEVLPFEHRLLFDCGKLGWLRARMFAGNEEFVFVVGLMREGDPVRLKE